MQDLVVSPAEVAGRTIISRELADDSNPAATQSWATGSPGTSPDALSKLREPDCRADPRRSLHIFGVSTHVNASALANLDFVAESISKAEVVGATITNIVAGPATALAKVKPGMAAVGRCWCRRRGGRQPQHPGRGAVRRARITLQACWRVARSP